MKSRGQELRGCGRLRGKSLPAPLWVAETNFLGLKWPEVWKMLKFALLYICYEITRGCWFIDNEAVWYLLLDEGPLGEIQNGGAKEKAALQPVVWSFPWDTAVVSPDSQGALWCQFSLLRNGGIKKQSKQKNLIAFVQCLCSILTQRVARQQQDTDRDFCVWHFPFAMYKMRTLLCEESNGVRDNTEMNPLETLKHWEAWLHIVISSRKTGSSLNLCWWQSQQKHKSNTSLKSHSPGG